MTPYDTNIKTALILSSDYLPEPYHKSDKLENMTKYHNKVKINS